MVLTFDSIPWVSLADCLHKCFGESADEQLAMYNDYMHARNKYLDTLEEEEEIDMPHGKPW